MQQQQEHIFTSYPFYLLWIEFGKMHQDIHWNPWISIKLTNGIKKHFSLLHIEVDTQNLAGNTVQYMISVPLLASFLC